MQPPTATGTSGVAISFLAFGSIINSSVSVAYASAAGSRRAPGASAKPANASATIRSIR